MIYMPRTLWSGVTSLQDRALPLRWPCGTGARLRTISGWVRIAKKWYSPAPSEREKRDPLTSYDGLVHMRPKKRYTVADAR